MNNPWLSVPLADYEGHMSAAMVNQLAALSALFHQALARCRPESVAILGIAGGNGLDHIDTQVTRRIVGVDIHPSYLEAVQQRFPRLPGLELHCLDLSASQPPQLPPVSLVHAALLFEHTGIRPALQNALSLVTPAGGRFSVVLQLPSPEQAGVASTGFASIQNLRDSFALIDPAQFQVELDAIGWNLVSEAVETTAGGKKLWLGIFERRSGGRPQA